MSSEPSVPRVALSSSERFFWNLLGDLVFEDSYSLSETVLACDPALEGMPTGEARELSAGVVLDLLERQWIFFFRLQGLSPNDAFERPDLRLSSRDAQDCVTRMLESGDTLTDIWIAPTDLGTAAANDPPPSIRSLWGWEAKS